MQDELLEQQQQPQIPLNSPPIYPPPWSQLPMQPYANPYPSPYPTPYPSPHPNPRPSPNTYINPYLKLSSNPIPNPSPNPNPNPNLNPKPSPSLNPNPNLNHIPNPNPNPHIAQKFKTHILPVDSPIKYNDISSSLGEEVSLETSPITIELSPQEETSPLEEKTITGTYSKIVVGQNPRISLHHSCQSEK